MVGIGVVLLGLIAYAFKIQVLDVFHNVTDVRRYASIVSSSGHGPGGRKLFPETIPAGATDVFFFHCPGALQAFYMLGLRCRLPKSDLAEIEADARRSGRKAYLIRPQGYVTNEYDPRQPGGVRVFVSELPEGFVVYMTDEEYKDYKASGNHGRTGFIAISHAREEVVFYYEAG
jgi:hypothetical protein